MRLLGDVRLIEDGIFGPAHYQNEQAFEQFQ